MKRSILFDREGLYSYAGFFDYGRLIFFVREDAEFFDKYLSGA
jgi:hypothetical protein